jgi:hypothetical protein
MQNMPQIIDLRYVVTEGKELYESCLLRYVRRKQMGLDTKALYFVSSKLPCTKYETVEKPQARQTKK